MTKDEKSIKIEKLFYIYPILNIRNDLSTKKIIDNVDNSTLKANLLKEMKKELPDMTQFLDLKYTLPTKV